MALPAASTNDTDVKGLLHALKPCAQAIDFTAKPVVVKVGKPVTTFFVNKDLICKASPFFSAARKEEWCEGRTRKVELEDQKPDSFNVYMNWLYSHKVVLGVDEDEDFNDQTPEYDLIDAYALGDMLLDVDFKDAVLDAMAANWLTTQNDLFYIPSAHQRAYLYGQTPAGSKLRQLLVCEVAQLKDSSSIGSIDDRDFLVDSMKYMLDIRDDERRCITNVLLNAKGCEFHEHEPGACYRKKYGNITELSL